MLLIASWPALMHRSTALYDGRGLMVASQDALGRFSTNVFDSLGRAIATVSPIGYRTSNSFDGRNLTIATQDALGFFHTAVFDPAGRAIANVNPLGFTNSMIFNGRGEPVASLDALGNRTSQVYDSVGRLLAQQNALGFLTSFVFDGAGETVAVVDANGHRTSSVFDQRGMLLATQDALGVFTSFAFDPAGNTILRTDGRNLRTSYTVDALNRTSGTLYNDGTRVTLTWDAAGQQSSSQDVTGIYLNGYDLAGRQINVVYPSGKTLSYSFDPVGNRVLLVDPDNGRTSYVYDLQNRLVRIVNPFAELTTIAFDALDRELHKTLGNGMSVNHIYDAAGREFVLGNYGPSGAALAVFTNTYDPVGNRLSVLEVDATRVTFGYDVTYQLILEQRNGANAYNTGYQHDGMGNRLIKSESGQITSSSFNAANALILTQPPSGPPTTSSYDGNGNLTLENAGGALTTYIWNGENRLAAVSSSTGIETYAYSDDGLRKQKVNGSGTTNYVWDGENVLLEANASQVTQIHYTDNPGIWGGLASQRQSGTSDFYGFDSQGSSRILMSIGGIITDNYSYKAFGEELAVGSGTANAMRYGGQYGYYRDMANRLQIRARELKVIAGRWISRDPIGFDANDWNLYRYVMNNPVNLLDPTGLATCSSECDDAKKECDKWEHLYYDVKNGECFHMIDPNLLGTTFCVCGQCCNVVAPIECLRQITKPKRGSFFPDDVLNCIRSCVASHEAKHCERCKCDTSKSSERKDCLGMKDPNTGKHTPLWYLSECEALLVSLECEQSCSSKCDTQQCRDNYRKFLSEQCAQAKSACKTYGKHPIDGIPAPPMPSYCK